MPLLSQSLRTCFVTLAHVFCEGLWMSDFSPDGPHAARDTARASVGISLMAVDFTAN